jgi:hypothetical protein
VSQVARRVKEVKKRVEEKGTRKEVVRGIDTTKVVFCVLHFCG